jgi:hypothetical protein
MCRGGASLMLKGISSRGYRNKQAKVLLKMTKINPLQESASCGQFRTAWILTDLVGPTMQGNWSPKADAFGHACLRRYAVVRLFQNEFAGTHLR